MWMKLRSYIGSRFWGRTFAEGSLRTWMHEEVVREYIRHGLFAASLPRARRKPGSLRLPGLSGEARLTL